MPNFFSSTHNREGFDRRTHCAGCGDYAGQNDDPNVDESENIPRPYSAVVTENPRSPVADEEDTANYVRHMRANGRTPLTGRGRQLSFATEQHMSYLPICSNCSMECDVCGHNHFADNLIPYNNRRGDDVEGHACPECAADLPECNECNQITNARRLTPAVSESIDDPQSGVCNYCLDRYYSYCNSCQDHVNDDLWSTGNGMCQDCYDNREPEEREEPEDDDRIEPYNHKPDPVFHGEGRHYGVELETVLKHGSLFDAVSKTLESLNSNPDKPFAYLKDDSSIWDWAKEKGLKGAFEIVTHPATVSEQKANWDKFFDNSPDGLISDPEEAPCCGLHIHIEKQYLSPLAIAKISQFIHAPFNRFLIKAIARRESERYAKLIPNKKMGDLQGDRYEAVNFKPEKTLELRIFAGTMDKEKFFQALEFADALTNFAAFGNSSIKEIPMSEGFTKHVAQNRKLYPNLHKLMARVVPSFPVIKGGIDPKRFSRSMFYEPTRREIPFKIGIVYGMGEKDMSEGAKANMLFH